MSEFVAPSDPQLAYIKSLCEDRGVTPPEAVHTKIEASEIIRTILTREYDPRRHRVTRDEIDRIADDEADTYMIVEQARYGREDFGDVPF